MISRSKIGAIPSIQMKEESSRKRFPPTFHLLTERGLLCEFMWTLTTPVTKLQGVQEQDYLVYLNNALIYWSSKKQTTVETSSFGSEFMAMKQATEYVRGLRFKLRSMGIPVQECCYIYGDNQSVLVNSSTLQSQLKKKSNSVAYHHVREGSALDEWRVTYINTNDNLADLLTKNLPAGEKRLKFC